LNALLSNQLLQFGNIKLDVIAVFLGRSAGDNLFSRFSRFRKTSRDELINIRHHALLGVKLSHMFNEQSGRKRTSETLSWDLGIVANSAGFALGPFPNDGFTPHQAAM